MKNLPSETPRAGAGHGHELYVGLDVHKDSISVAYAEPGQQLYERLKARGKPGKLALTAIMRKLVVLANVLIQDDRLWTPSAS